MSADNDVMFGIRQAILRGDFAPRQRLVEADLCERFHGSRFEVRAALQLLESEGLVERERNRGARVREISLEEAIQITEVRQAVEGLVSRLAAERRSDEDANRLRDIGRQMRQAVEAGDSAMYGDLNVALHAALRNIAAHGTANRIIEQLHGQMVRHQFALSRVPGRSAVSVLQHEAIIAAVADGDPDGAEDAMRRHIASVADALRALV